MDMISLLLIFFFQRLVYSDDVCRSVNCGSGICKTTRNPTLPYYCQCPNGSNSILPCPMQNPCSRNPCGHGVCEVVPKLLYGYLCRCAGDTISLTNCNATHNACASSPCIHGVCIEGLTSFICDCLPSWTGRTCQEKIGPSCTNHLCGSGKCFAINDPSLLYVCLCPNGLLAPSCKNHEIRLTTGRMLISTSQSLERCDPMKPDSCMNAGQCLPTMDGYQCLCTSGFTGKLCQIKTNACVPNPCLHGGVCYDLQSSYICGCPDGSFRTQCLPKLMMTNTARSLVCPCQNEGFCPMMGSEICTCPKEFTGVFCEIASDKNEFSHSFDTDQLQRLAPSGCQQLQCSNGGTCYPGTPSSPSASCLCKNGYTGKVCEIEYFQCQTNGRFADRYNCDKGKYFECVHQGQGSANKNGVVFSRSCPATLRFNVLIDGCDYPINVHCNQN